MKMTNRIGPSTLPWGIPLSTREQDDSLPFTPHAVSYLVRNFWSTSWVALLFHKRQVLRVVFHGEQSQKPSWSQDKYNPKCGQLVHMLYNTNEDPSISLSGHEYQLVIWYNLDNPIFTLNNWKWIVYHTVLTRVGVLEGIIIFF